MGVLAECVKGDQEHQQLPNGNSVKRANVFGGPFKPLIVYQRVGITEVLSGSR